MTRTAADPRALAPARERPWRMLIDGELTEALTGGTTDAIDPATEEVIATFPSALPSDVDRAVAAAKRAFATWGRTPAAERAGRILALADAIEASGEELAVLDTLDNGSPLRVMRNDYLAAVEQLRYFAGIALHIRGETIPPPDSTSIDLTIRQPYGVVGRIVPFNHPLMFAAAKIAAPLVAGNTVVLKPALDTSLSALRLGELARTVLPPGVLNIVTGPGGVIGDHLVRHPDVPRLAFTGSVEIGQRLLQQASAVGVKTVSLELGGKNPCVVFADADVDKAVAGAVNGMNFTWQGQSCGSTSRLYVHRSLFERFIVRVAERLERMVVGDPFDQTTDVGAIVSRRQFDKVRSYLDAGATHAGVQLVTGGVHPTRRGWFIRPTLFTVADESATTLACDEIFGPVLVAMAFDEYDEVIARANALAVGLTASVWTTDLGLAMRAIHDLACGYVWVNASSAHVPGTPFGGWRQSGLGREEGIDELLGYTQPKNVFLRYG